MNSQNSVETSFGEADGPMLLGATRDTISEFLKTRKKKLSSAFLSDSRFNQKMGCFVTLKQNDPEKSLRGCIGFPEPVYELKKALSYAAISAATEDPRFPPVRIGELSNLLLEISLLTKPEEITVKNPKELLKRIEVGKDGLVMRWSFGAGLLLPQVAAEYDWDVEDYLINLSMKAGAPPDQWLVPGTLVYKFRAQVFQEDSPGGRVRVS